MMRTLSDDRDSCSARGGTGQTLGRLKGRWSTGTVLQSVGWPVKGVKLATVSPLSSVSPPTHVVVGDGCWSRGE